MLQDAEECSPSLIRPFNETYDVTSSSLSLCSTDTTAFEPQSTNTAVQMRDHSEGSGHLELFRTPGTVIIDKSFKRKFTSVLKEFVEKRDSFGVDPTILNPSTILALKAEQATPTDQQHVSFPLQSSYEFSQISSRKMSGECNQDKNLPELLAENVNSQSSIYLTAKSSRTDKMISEPADVSRRMVPFKATPALSENSSIHNGDLRRGSRVTPNPVVVISCSSPMNNIGPDTTSDVIASPTLESNMVFKKLSFTNESDRSSVSQSVQTPTSKQYDSNGDGSYQVSKSTGSWIKRTASWSSHISPLRHRGSYTVPQQSVYSKYENTKNHRMMIIGLILTVFGVLFIIASFVVLFVVVPYYDSLEV